MGAMTPFEADVEILMAARLTGYTSVTRRPVVRVDDKLLPPAYYRRTPDYGAIRKALLDGVLVSGAELTTDVVYVLQRPSEDGE